MNLTLMSIFQGSFLLTVTVEDIDDGKYELVDKIIVKNSLNVGSSSSFTRDSNGNLIELQVHVVCAENYYGSDCSKRCEPTDDKHGHYTCNGDGTKSCLKGWTGTDCDVNINDCNPDPCAHGSCTVSKSL